ncbi:hypothetical protein RHGRI_033095 [Rhododendron griersonianum]|uniref:BI1-like protein n=1 Tax=Rhododendron griersonianum TaxID=479676 RepID=A0AAV6HVX9_9ERIC|nr:hypothetical protein RHGRI_033095 [Rhododendron griersonianum]
METMKKSTGDIEAGVGDNVDLRWAFIRKVYVILALQLLLTVAVATVVVLVAAIPKFIVTTTPGLLVFIVAQIAPFIVLFPLHRYSNHHPVNLVLLTLFTVLIAFSVGLSCSFSPDLRFKDAQSLNALGLPLVNPKVFNAWMCIDRGYSVILELDMIRHLLVPWFIISSTALIRKLINGKVVLLTGILTSVVVVTLTLYTFWAAARGHDFSFLGPFLMVSLLVLIVFSLIQIFIPFGKLGSTIFGLLVTIIFSGFIIYDTDNLIKRCKYDEYIWASINLYLDIANLFLGMLGVSRWQ